MDRASKAGIYRSTFIGQQVDVEVVTRLTQADGSTSEVIELRRMVGKKWRRKGNRTIIDLADIDREALKQVYPLQGFTVADFPNLFTDHVNRRIPEGVGQVMHVPLSLINNAGGSWTYAGPKVLSASGTLQTVYRGTQPDNGSIVNASEYTASTSTGAATGVVVNTVVFTREQVGLDGQPYVLTADYLLPGTRTAAAEIQRILTALGIAYDATSFGTASANDIAAGFLIDALYGGDANGKAGNAIVEDHLRIARGWLTQSTTGAWAILQDVAKASSLQLDTSTDRVSVDEYGDGDIDKTVTVAYRPRASAGEDFTGKLQRTTVGSSGEKVISLPYVRDHVVADRLASYWQKRLNVDKRASAWATGIRINGGDVITITDANELLGTKDFIAYGVSRPADRQDWKLRAYDADVYVYAASTLPADATTGYSPDYSFTAPAAPTGLAVISQGTSVDADGKISSYALIRATPPAVNWQKVMVQVKNTATNEIEQAQLLLNGGNYEAVIGRLRPNQAHTVVAWAVNSNNVDGATTSAVGFTSATNSNVPTTPTPAAIGQTYTLKLHYEWTASAPGSGAPPLKEYVIEESVNGGAYAPVQTVAAPNLTWEREGVTVGSTYAFRVKARDRVGNESAYATSGTVTAQKMLTDAYIQGSGISGPSIANSSINRGRASTGTGSASGTVGAGGSVSIGMDYYTFFPATYAGPTANAVMTPTQASPSDDFGAFRILSNAGSDSYLVRWRSMQP